MDLKFLNFGKKLSTVQTTPVVIQWLHVQNVSEFRILICLYIFRLEVSSENLGKSLSPKI